MRLLLNQNCPQYCSFELGANPPDLQRAWFLANESHLGAVVRRLDPVLDQQQLERIQLAYQAAGKPPGLIGAVVILGNPLTEPCLPRPPLSARGWSRGPMAEAL
jgi:hypothetical protein